ncbi:hypothetical protein ABIF66_010850 [Bradyrhizobium japonicum]
MDGTFVGIKYQLSSASWPRPMRLDLNLSAQPETQVFVPMHGDPIADITPGLELPLGIAIGSRQHRPPNQRCERAAQQSRGATVNPIFTWVRLAQRIPIRIHIDEVPTGIVLTAGMTAAVQVEPRSGRPIGSLGVECSSNYACCAPVRAPSIL